MVLRCGAWGGEQIMKAEPAQGAPRAQLSLPVRGHREKEPSVRQGWETESASTFILDFLASVAIGQPVYRRHSTGTECQALQGRKSDTAIHPVTALPVFPLEKVSLEQYYKPSSVPRTAPAHSSMHSLGTRRPPPLISAMKTWHEF
ncbi:uncharacterized protein LOC110598265 isoform X1 [Ictidomys tridecemlineatus]